MLTLFESLNLNSDRSISVCLNFKKQRSTLQLRNGSKTLVLNSVHHSSRVSTKIITIFKPPSDTGSYETYARSDTGEYCAYDQRHNQAARKMHQILRRIKMLKIAAVMQAPLLIVMVVMLFGYPELLFGDPCLSVNATTTLMNSTMNSTMMNSTTIVSNTTLGK